MDSTKPAGDDAGVSVGLLKTAISALTLGIRRNISAAIAKAVDVRVGILEDRVKTLELQPTLRYRGVFSADATYGLGDFVTCNGSVWHANRTTRTRPGSDGSWTLAVKAGQTR